MHHHPYIHLNCANICCRHKISQAGCTWRYSYGIQMSYKTYIWVVLRGKKVFNTGSSCFDCLVTGSNRLWAGWDGFFRMVVVHWRQRQVKISFRTSACIIFLCRSDCSLYGLFFCCFHTIPGCQKSGHFVQSTGRMDSSRCVDRMSFCRALPSWSDTLGCVSMYISPRTWRFIASSHFLCLWGWWSFFFFSFLKSLIIFLVFLMFKARKLTAHQSVSF